MAGTQATRAKDTRDSTMEVAEVAETADAPEAPETFRVVNGTLLHDGQAYPVGAAFRCDDVETIHTLRACRAIALPEEAMQIEMTQTLDENAALRDKVRELERQIADARARIDSRERVF